MSRDEPPSSAADTGLVSVVIPTHNRAHLIGRAVDSVLAQSFSDWECLVIDDGSTDETEQVVTAFKDSRIQYFRQENRGASAARNKGIEEAQGEYIAFLDSDDEWLPQKLSRQMELFMASDHNPGVIYTGALKIDSRSGEADLSQPTLKGDVFHDLLFELQIVFSTVVVKKDVLDRVGWLDESMPRGMDRDLMLRLALRTKFDGIAEPLVRQYQYHGPHLKGDTGSSVVYKRRLLEKLKTMPCVPKSALSHHHRSLGILLFRDRAYRQAAKHMLASIRYRPVDVRPYAHLARIASALVFRR